MGPLCRKRSRSTRKLKSSREKTPPINQIERSDTPDSSILPSTDAEVGSSSACSTPKGERFRIPEIKTCPRAPKKRRVITGCSLRRTSIAFFVPPDIDLFFSLYCCGIPV